MAAAPGPEQLVHGVLKQKQLLIPSVVSCSKQFLYPSNIAISSTTGSQSKLDYSLSPKQNTNMRQEKKE